VLKVTASACSRDGLSIFTLNFIVFCGISFFRNSTNVVMNYTEIEGKVREATNDDPWGPTGVLMQELAHSTFTYEHFPEVMSMLWRRMLQDNKTNWRRTYKVSRTSIINRAIPSTD
jgi:ENTH domain